MQRGFPVLAENKIFDLVNKTKASNDRSASTRRFLASWIRIKRLTISSQLFYCLLDLQKTSQYFQPDVLLLAGFA